MKRILPTMAALFTAAVVAGSPGPAAASCAGNGMEKAATVVDSTVYSPAKVIMTRELAAANDAMSKGDMRDCNRHLHVIERMGAHPAAWGAGM